MRGFVEEGLGKAEALAHAPGIPVRDAVPRASGRHAQHWRCSPSRRPPRRAKKYAFPVRLS